MGSCLSKKSICASSSSSPVALPKPPEKLHSESHLDLKKAEKEPVVKKEVFIIKHRISHETERQRSDEESSEVKNVAEVVEKGINATPGDGLDGGGVTAVAAVGGGAPVRTSSCTKEEVDAILIQCGRLSRSSSTGKKYSGSKRSYDFDNDNGRSDGNNAAADGDDDAVARERENRRRERHRQSQGRRRTPSREREKDQAAAQQRSGSRERAAAGSGGGRRVSRSPGRRSESPITTNSNSTSTNTNSKPGKMVSVPATVSSGGGATAGEPISGTAVKRIQVKRNVGGEVGNRTGSSPRARSPANIRASNENQNVNLNQNQPISLSRSNSRKAEVSPYRRNPLGEIDTNIISQAPPIQKPNADKTIVQGAENRMNQQQQQHIMAEETKGQYGISGHVGLNVISSNSSLPENPKPNNAAVARTRSSRLSRDFDISPETLSNPNATSSSYTALLLEDIQNFHQKNTTPPPPSFSLPPCVTKACSILEAVADLNNENKPVLSHHVRKTAKTDPTKIMESEVVVDDDLMEPSFHKYVTVRRGGTTGVEDQEEEDDLEEQESSGSNSINVGSQQQWMSSSCWEPNSAESTDRWTCSSASRSVSRSKDESGKRVISAKKRINSDKQQQQQHSGIGRGRIGTQISSST